ncbi:alternate-type signal peptide domain-containing protein [Georgenia yuyongxinii]|uniref:Alternate-type signal peptide domain-containing protein n=1 Tax=Georgenia yuyongxinii TaxID=2589797 RepID=A0A552WUA3_9MICO|nr:alternate-type signal peptide domain-containing protein [Georgenia yuyongxinii]TRW46420.1 alternate-type signal peptide domain-containing protein [Georgenia yuyongxinii]
MTTLHTTPTAKRPRRRGKILFSAGAAVAIFLGGAGTFATWQDNEEIDPGTINVGTLALEQGANAGEWTEVTTGNPVDLASYSAAPGTHLLYEETVLVEAKGTGILGTLSTNIEDVTVAPVETRHVFTVDGKEITAKGLIIDETYDGKEVLVQVYAELPDTVTGTTGQGMSIPLQKINVVLTQGLTPEAQTFMTYETERSKLYTLRNDIIQLGPLAMDSGLPITAALQDHLDNASALYTYIVEPYDLDLEGSLEDAQADLDSRLAAQETVVEAAQNAVYALPGNVKFSDEYVLSTATATFPAGYTTTIDPIAQSVRSGHDTGQWYTSAFPGPFRANLTGTVTTVPGFIDNGDGTFKMDGSTPGSYEMTWVIEEVNPAGDVIDSTEVTYTQVFK